MWCAWSFFIVYKNLLPKCIQSFPYWEDGKVLPPTKNLLIHPLPTKFLFPPTKSQFNPIKKTPFLAVVIAPVPFFEISYSFETKIMLILILIDVQYLQNAVFSFEKFSISQNRSSSGSHHLAKKSPQQCSLLFDTKSGKLLKF